MRFWFLALMWHWAPELSSIVTYAQHTTGSTVAFLMTRFVCGMVMPKMVTSLVVRLSVHASVGADVD